jgi:hypothetical protein
LDLKNVLYLGIKLTCHRKPNPNSETFPLKKKKRLKCQKCLHQ